MITTFFKFVDTQGALQRGPQDSLTPKDIGVTSGKFPQPHYVCSGMILATTSMPFLAPTP